MEQNKYICIHGHFYQPPRENAWLEEIQNQVSAAPFNNWNERINYECYAPNRAARDYLKLAPAEGIVWKSSAMKNEGKAKADKLTKQGMSAGAIYQRVEMLGRHAGTHQPDDA